MINRTRAYEKFLTLLNQIENSDISLDEQKELLDEMKSDIEFKMQQVYADQNEWQKPNKIKEKYSENTLTEDDDYEKFSSWSSKCGMRANLGR